MNKLITLAALMLAIVSCKSHTESEQTNAAFNLDSVRTAIEANNKQFAEAFAKNDSALFVSLFTKDGCLMPDAAPKMCGPEALTAFLRGGIEMGMVGMNLTIVELTGGPELVAEEGLYEVLAKDGMVVEKGKFIVTWKQEDGVWKRYRDIWNSETPPPPPAK